MTLKKVYEITGELETALVTGWHSMKTKRELCRELVLSHHKIENMWTQLRKEGKLPTQRRTGFGGRAPGEQNSIIGSVRMPTITVMFATEEETIRRQQAASERLLELLREHHGCGQKECGRYDIPPALLKIEKQNARRIRRPYSV